MIETFHPRRKGPSRSFGFLLILPLLIFPLVLLLMGNNLYGAINHRYEITPSQLEIRYGFQTHRIPLDQVQRVWLLERPTKAVRRNGTSTPGTKQGSWSFAETGKISLYATELENMVVIETEAKKWGISPADRVAFIQALESGSPALFLPAGSTTRNLLGMAIPLAVVLVAMAITLVLVRQVSRFHRDLRYELGPDGLTIITGWRPVQVAYRDVHRVEIASPKGSPLKIAGSQVGGVLWGSFAWKAAGPKLRLYATEAKPLVLIRLKDRTFGINPEDAEGFVAAFQQRQRPRW